jgi:Putative Mg2+ and Co2+ transporter CorC
MLEGVMQISDMRVRDIMIPRSQMVIVERSQSLEAIINIIIDAQHSRYPVISDDKDHVEGILLAKDLLRYLRPDAEDFDIEKVLRPVWWYLRVNAWIVCSKSSKKSAITWRLSLTSLGACQGS